MQAIAEKKSTNKYSSIFFILLWVEINDLFCCVSLRNLEPLKKQLFFCLNLFNFQLCMHICLSFPVLFAFKFIYLYKVEYRFSNRIIYNLCWAAKILMPKIKYKKAVIKVIHILNFA